MSRYRNNRDKGTRQQGAKQISKNRFAAFDPDICSNYDDQEDDTPGNFTGFYI